MEHKETAPKIFINGSVLYIFVMNVFPRWFLLIAYLLLKEQMDILGNNTYVTFGGKVDEKSYTYWSVFDVTLWLLSAIVCYVVAVVVTAAVALWDIYVVSSAISDHWPK